MLLSGNSFRELSERVHIRSLHPLVQVSLKTYSKIIVIQVQLGKVAGEFDYYGNQYNQQCFGPGSGHLVGSGSDHTLRRF